MLFLFFSQNETFIFYFQVFLSIFQKTNQKNKARQYKTIQGKFKEIQGNSKQGNSKQGNTRQIQGNSKQGNSIQSKAIQGNSRQYKAIQGNSRGSNTYLL